MPEAHTAIVVTSSSDLGSSDEEVQQSKRGGLTESPEDSGNLLGRVFDNDIGNAMVFRPTTFIFCGNLKFGVEGRHS